MPAEDKIAFVSNENLANLMVYVVYETDLSVLKHVFLSPELSIQMLTTLQKYLKKRGFGPNDNMIHDLVNKTIKIRKNRVVKISSLLKIKENNNADSAIPAIFEFLLDDDESVVESAVNAINNFEYEDFISVLFRDKPFPREGHVLDHQFWQILQKLNQHTMVLQKSITEKHSPGDLSFYDVKIQILGRKLQLLQKCSSDLSNREKLLTIVCAQLDTDPVVQEKINKILNLEELISLLRDESISHSTVKEAIKILKNHPSESIHRQLDDLFVLLSKRVQKQLKEMETTINAYFDIIFNSLGYPKVHRIKQAIKILSTTKELTGRFFLETHNKKDQEKLSVLFKQIEGFYDEKLKEAHFSLNLNHVREIADIYEMVKLIINMPEEIIKKQGYLFEKNAEDYENQVQKARLLWRTTTGQYLGRLKELAELFKEKWIALLEDKSLRNEFDSDFTDALGGLEKKYKKTVGCNLTIRCVQCNKRSCAGERFLTQIEFILGEFLDFLEEDVYAEEKELN
jgi:hypothetical protein